MSRDRYNGGPAERQSHSARNFFAVGALIAIAGGYAWEHPDEIDAVRTAFSHNSQSQDSQLGSSDNVTDSSVGEIYGPGIGYDTKANVPVGPAGQKVAIMFKASTNSELDSVRWVQRGGDGYSHGNGGTITLSVRADDGYGHPSNRSLASESIRPGNPSGDWEKYDPVSFRKPPVLTAGKTYFVEFTNPDPENYISVNNVYAFNATKPRQPMFSDSDLGVLISKSGSWGSPEPGYTPVVDLTYDDGTHDGQAYFAAMIDEYATISGASKMVREQFTVSGGDRKVASAALRLRRSIGTSPLTLTLENAGSTPELSGGSPIESVTIPAADIPVSVPGGDNGGAVWAKANFASPHVLKDGSTYNLRVSTASDTTYTTFTMLAGLNEGFKSPYFRNGTGQSTTNGSKWAKIYEWNHQDLQVAFTQTP